MTFMSKGPFTDLSKPLVITDPVKFRAAIHTIMSILFYNRMDAVQPVVASESVSCIEPTTTTEPGL
jgi:hypothetical protein